MECNEHPFKHFIKQNFFTEENYLFLKDYVLRIPWEFFLDEDFPQYISPKNEVENFFLHDKNSSLRFKYLFEHEFINEIKDLFSVNLNECVDISFHKLIKGCFNVVHNDLNSIGEKVRIVCYLSDPKIMRGGELNLFENFSQTICY